MADVLPLQWNVSKDQEERGLGRYLSEQPVQRSWGGDGPGMSRGRVDGATCRSGK